MGRESADTSSLFGRGWFLAGLAVVLALVWMSGPVEAKPGKGRAAKQGQGKSAQGGHGRSRSQGSGSRGRSHSNRGVRRSSGSRSSHSRSSGRGRSRSSRRTRSSQRRSSAGARSSGRARSRRRPGGASGRGHGRSNAKGSGSAKGRGAKASKPKHRGRGKSTGRYLHGSSGNGSLGDAPGRDEKGGSGRADAATQLAQPAQAAGIFTVPISAPPPSPPALPGGASPLVPGSGVAGVSATSAGLAATAGFATPELAPALPGAAGDADGSGGGLTSSGAGASSGLPTGEAAGGPQWAVNSPFAQIIERIPRDLWLVLAALAGTTLAFAGLALLSAGRARRASRAVEEIRTVADTDTLTGLLNRGAFEEALTVEISRARRYARPLSVAYIDVQSLKAVNDAHGHQAGDRLLQSVAGVIRATSRGQDISGRLGGDECAVGLIEQDPEGAEAFCRRLEEQIPTRRTTLGLRTEWGITSGIASFPDDGDTAVELLSAADKRLYARRGIHIEP